MRSLEEVLDGSGLDQDSSSRDESETFAGEIRAFLRPPGRLFFWAERDDTSLLMQMCVQAIVGAQ